MEKAITVMLDDILNNFSGMLSEMGISYDAEKQSIFDPEIMGVFTKPPGELTDTAIKIFTETAPRQDGIDFFKWLKENGWTVVLCVNRDIRLCYEITKKWLSERKIQYDYLFTATTPAGLCADLDVPFLIYNLPKGGEDHFNVVLFQRAEDNDYNDDIDGIDGNEQKKPVLLGDFRNYEDVKRCILKSFRQNVNF